MGSVTIKMGPLALATIDFDAAGGLNALAQQLKVATTQTLPDRVIKDVFEQCKTTHSVDLVPIFARKGNLSPLEALTLPAACRNGVLKQVVQKEWSAVPPDLLDVAVLPYLGGEGEVVLGNTRFEDRSLCLSSILDTLKHGDVTMTVTDEKVWPVPASEPRLAPPRAFVQPPLNDGQRDLIQAFSRVEHSGINQLMRGNVEGSFSDGVNALRLLDMLDRCGFPAKDAQGSPVVKRADSKEFLELSPDSKPILRNLGIQEGSYHHRHDFDHEFQAYTTASGEIDVCSADGQSHTYTVKGYVSISDVREYPGHVMLLGDFDGEAEIIAEPMEYTVKTARLVLDHEHLTATVVYDVVPISKRNEALANIAAVMPETRAEAIAWLERGDVTVSTGMVPLQVSAEQAQSALNLMYDESGKKRTFT